MQNDPNHLPNAPGTLDQKKQELLEACLEALHELAPVKWRLHAGRENAQATYADHRLDLGLDGTTTRLTVEVKQALRPANIGPLAHRARQLERQGERLLLFAERIPDKLGAELREHGVAYVDRGGNAWLQAPGVFVLVAGCPPVGRPRQRPHLRGTDVRLLGVFLIDPGAGEAVQAYLAQRAGIALGAVGCGRETLERLGILELMGKRRWRVRNREEGLRRFGDGWAALVRPKLNPVTCRLLAVERHGDLEKRLEAAGPELGCLLGGERAAAHLTRHLQTQQATLHVPAARRKEAMTALLVAPDKTGPVTLLDRYGLGDEHHAPELPGVALAHPLLVWAECLTVPDERVAQTAAQLHEALLRAEDE